MGKRSGKSNTEMKKISKQELLKAGAELVDPKHLNPFAELKVGEISQRAKYSTGAFYQHWATLSDYQRDLAAYLLASGEELFAGDFAKLRAEADKSSGSLVDDLTRIAKRDFKVLIDNPLWDAMELLNLTWGRSEFLGFTRDGYDNVDVATGEFYGQVLDRFGREPRPPLSGLNELGRVLQGLIEGLGLRHRADPEALKVKSERGIGLYALAAVALMPVLTRRPEDSRTVFEVVEDLLK